MLRDVRQMGMFENSSIEHNVHMMSEVRDECFMVCVTLNAS